MLKDYQIYLKLSIPGLCITQLGIVIPNLFGWLLLIKILTSFCLRHLKFKNYFFTKKNVAGNGGGIIDFPVAVWYNVGN